MVRYLFYTIGDLTYQSPLVVHVEYSASHYNVTPELYCFFKRLFYCSEMYKCLHEFAIKTVPDTSLHETSDLIYAIEVYYVETTFMLKAVK